MTVGGPVAPGTEDPLLGLVLSERYRILGKLGEGGMGVVYLAEHIVIEKKIALKVLFPDLTRRADLVQRFIQEAKSASRIGHENVIDITDFGQSPEGYVFIAMEYLSGQDLGEVLKASGPMPWSRAQPLVLQIVKALRAAHERGIVHRDMKPENIFIIPRDDGREFVKVLDFGIAKVMGLDEDAPRLTRTGMIFGTPEYMSPEQAQGQQVDHRVDIYAVGCIMYQILTGKVPFEAETFMGILSKHMMEVPVPPRTLNPAIDAGLESIILKAMEKDPARRFQSMRELVVALVPAGSGVGLSGAISTSPAMTAPRTVLPASLSRPATVPERSPVTGPAVGSAPTGSVSPFPYATHEIAGRTSSPLAASNPEVRRSRTEIFERGSGAGDRVSGRGRSSKALVIAVGVATVVLTGALVLSLRHKNVVAPTTIGAAVTGVAPSSARGNQATAIAGAGAVGAAPASAKPSLAPAPTGGPATDPTAVGAKGDAAKLDSANVEFKAKTTSETKTYAQKLDGKKHRHHRSSREAVDGLQVPGDGSPAAPASPGVRTPLELKNPFAP
jgi:serine/threonine protein kinase